MWRLIRTKLPLRTLASTLVVLAVSGCAEYRVPRIDPSGEHLFVYDSPPATCPPGTVPAPPPGAARAVVPVPAPAVPAPVVVAQPVSPYSDAAVTLGPPSTLAPVRSQVVMVAGVVGGDNYLRTNRRLEWWLGPNSAGQFTAIGKSGFADLLVGDFTRPHLVSGSFAIGSTTREAEQAGTPPGIVRVARGQGWITVSSPVEGVSQVAVTAPSVVVPGERSKTATIYWYDAQFGFPGPIATPAGGQGALTTTVLRLTSGGPRAGWIVRYEIIGGPQAVFVPSAATAVEAPTDEGGRATVQIVQKDPSPGTSQVRVQVFRPADACGGRMLVRECSVPVAWSAPALDIRQMGPPTAILGGTVTYRIEVSNPGDLPARELVLNDETPDGLTFLQGAPPPVVEGRRLLWRLGDLAPRQQQIVEVTFRAGQLGSVAHCVEVTGAGGLRSNHCASTTVQSATPVPAAQPLGAGPAPAQIPPPGAGPTPAAPSVLELKITPRSLAVVGSTVTFDIDVFNRGTTMATGVVLYDKYGPGFTHEMPSPIGFKLGNLPPGGTTRHAVTFHVTKAGQLCHQVEVNAADGGRAIQDSCVTAAPPGNTYPGTPGATTAPPSPLLEIRASADSATATVGQLAVFSADIRNPGTQPLASVVISQQADAALTVLQATDGARSQGKEYVWTVPSMPAGKTVRVQVQCKCQQPADRACCRFVVTPAGGQAAESQACIAIVAAPAAPPSRLSVRVDNRNTVTAGNDQQFLVQVANDGDSPENDVVVTAHLPPGSALVELGTTGPDASVKFEKSAGLVRFSPVATLPPKTTIDYRVIVTTSKPGPIDLLAEAVSRRQTQPATGSKTVNILPAE